MKSTILRSGAALACALGLAACGGGGDIYLSGRVLGVTQPGLVLQNNGGNDLAVGVNPSTGQYDYFQFPNRVSTDDAYNITVKSVPPNIEQCYPTDITGAKTIASGHANYYSASQTVITCFAKMHHLKVKVVGLTSTGLVLINGTDKVTVDPAKTNDLVSMADVAQDANYGVTVLTQPAGQTCTVSGGGDANNGSGKVGATDVTNVVVTCS
jgi:hypothetical protein